MNKKQIILASALILLLSFFAFEKLTYQPDVVKAEAISLNATDQAEKPFSIDVNDRIRDIKDIEFVVSKNIERLANLMVEDSNHRFKKNWATFLIKEAYQYEIDPLIVYELLKVETGHTFSPDTIGPPTIYGYAYGMSQFMENTAPWIADMAGLPYEKQMLFDPYYSMTLAVVYLDYLYDRYENWDEALTAYHRGMTGMKNYKDRNGTARSYYAELIQDNADSHQLIAFLN